MTIRVERHGLCAEIVMDRPEAMNAISSAQAQTIAQVCRELGEDPNVTVVVLSSAVDRAFCVGADLKERASMSTEDLLAQRPILTSAFRGVLDLPVPVIAVVEGFALGGGFELALSCDLIVAGAGAKFGLPEVGVGLIPGGGGTQLLIRRVGSNRAADVILTGRQLSAEEAANLGCVDRVAAAGEAREVALALAEQIATKSPLALRQAKRAMRLGSDLPLQEGLAIEEQAWQAMATSEDRREGIAAFVEKRAPQWPAQDSPAR